MKRVMSRKSSRAPTGHLHPQVPPSASSCGPLAPQGWPKMRHWLAFVALLHTACSAGEPQSFEKKKAPLTQGEVRTLGFEAVADWYKFSGAGALQQSSLHSEGASSIRLSGMGFIGIRNSTPITKDQHPAPAVVGYDVLIPTNQVNPSWHGDTQLYVTAPSAGIYEQYLGNRSLQNLPKGQFTRVEFPLSDTIRQKLNTYNYTDLRFTVVINVAPGSQPHYVDRFILGPDPGTAPCTPVNDNNPCTADACNPATGQTTHIPLAPGATCSNSNACDGVEVCDGAGTCQAGTPPALDDGNSCTADICNSATGVTHPPEVAGVSCADDDVCDGEETCDGSGACEN